MLQSFRISKIASTHVRLTRDPRVEPHEVEEILCVEGFLTVGRMGVERPHVMHYPIDMAPHLHIGQSIEIETRV